MIPFISSNLSALRAFGKKLSVIANNVANIESEGFKKSRAVLVEDPKNHVSVDIKKRCLMWTWLKRFPSPLLQKPSIAPTSRS
jgi:hypothetical protein